MAQPYQMHVVNECTALIENRTKRRAEKKLKYEQDLLWDGNQPASKSEVQALGLLVSISYTHYCASTFDLSNS